MNKKLLRCLGVCVLLSGLITSCDGGNNSSNGGDTGEVTGDKYAGNTGLDCDVVLPSDDPSSVKTITFWHCLGHDKEENLNKIVESFNKKYDGKYKVELFKLNGDYDSLHDSVKTKLASGEVPALCMGYPDSFSEYITHDIENSSILRLNNLISDPNVGFTDAEKADFVSEYYLEGQNYQFSGTWSLPIYKSTEVLYYNENFFRGDNLLNQNHFKNTDKASEYNSLAKAVADGTNNPSEESLKALEDFCKANGGYTYSVPTTWDEMFTIAKQMKADYAKENISSEFYPVGYDSDSNLFISQFEQRGISYTTNNGTEASDHFLFNNDKAKSFASEVTGLIKDKLLITKGSLGGSKYTSNYFTAGSLAMSVGSTGGSSYQISSNFKVGLAPVPYSNNNAKYIMQGPSVCFFNNGDDYIAKGAWLFYKELSDPTNNAALALENSYDPVRISSYSTSDYQAWLAKKGQGLKYDIPAITATLKENYMTSPVFIGSSTARTEVGNIIKYVVNQNMSIDDAFKTAINECVKAASED